MSEHSSPWLTGMPRPSWPAVSGTIDVDFVIVGAGIFGLTTASLLSQEGHEVAVLEALRVGAGTTGGTTGKATSQHGLIYRTLIERHGLEATAVYAAANQQALDDIETSVQRMGVDCGFQRLPTYVYTRNPDRRGDLESEQAAAEELGLPANLTTETDLPFPVELAVRFDDQAVFDVGPYLYSLAEDLGSAAGLVYEHSRVVRLTEGDDSVTVHTAEGRVRAKAAVVATLIPFLDRSGFFARMKPSRAYGVAAQLRGGGLSGAHISVDHPTRSTRPWRTGSGEGIVVVGEEHPVGHGKARPGRWGELERWARKHFEVESFEHRWSAQDFETVDLLPYIGAAPLTRRTYVATGFRKWGLTNATSAAHIVADLITGRPNPRADVFDPARIGDASTIARIAKLNLHVATRFVRDRLQRFSAPAVDELELGEAGIVKVGDERIAVYRTPDDDLQAVAPRCTHLGCFVRWNHAEKSWDCPCHGSRFATDGRVLTGPATEPLKRVEIERGEGSWPSS